MFAKSPVPGRVKTRMKPVLSDNQCARLQQQLIEHTLLTATREPLCPVQLWFGVTANPFIHNCANLYRAELHAQADGDLGVRMLHAFNSALTSADYALIIGSDCPALTPNHLRHALQALHDDSASVVIIPAEDGGYVLIGTRSIQPGLFYGVDWGTSKVLQQTRHNIQRLHLTSVEFEPLWDIDQPEDLHRLQQLGNNQHWEAFLCH